MAETPEFFKDTILALRSYGSGSTNDVLEKVTGRLYGVGGSTTTDDERRCKIAMRFLASIHLLSNLPEEVCVTQLRPLANELADTLVQYEGICQNPERAELGSESMRVSLCVLTEMIHELQKRIMGLLTTFDNVSKFEVADLSILVCATDSLMTAIGAI